MTNTATAIAFSEEQAMLLETAESYCRDKAQMDAVRALIETDRGFDDAVWREMGELGWLGIAIPEEFGGSGLGLSEVVAIVEPMGQRLLDSPFISTILAAQTLITGGTSGQQRQWLPRIAEGMAATVALFENNGDWDLNNVTCSAEMIGDNLLLSGEKSFVANALEAELFIVSLQYYGATSLVLVERSALSDENFDRETVMDETRRSYRVDFTGVTIPVANLLDQKLAARALRRLDLVACLLNAAESCGGTLGALQYTVDYLNTRLQFERFIGSYQALKHPTVDVLLGYDASRSLLYHAATVFETADGEAATRMAKAKANDTFAFAGDRAVQFHGAFGFTYDCDAQLYLRRALWNQTQHGDPAYQRRLLQPLLLD